MVGQRDSIERGANGNMEELGIYATKESGTKAKELERQEVEVNR